MFKNKFVLGFIALALLVIIIYSLSTSEDYPTRALNDREKYQSDLLTMDGSPLTGSASGGKFDFYPADKNWVIEADFVAEEKAGTFQMEMTDSTTQESKMAGKASFLHNGQKTELLIFDEGDAFLLPFRDATNGQETYGGGRYINIPKKDLLGGKMTIDFNRAHNFYCAYSEKYICPVPPRENRVSFAVTAGEKIFKH